MRFMILFNQTINSLFNNIRACSPFSVARVSVFVFCYRILCLLVGYFANVQVHDKLEMLPQARQWRLYALHSQMPTNQQRDVFLRPPRGMRKVSPPPLTH